MDKDEQIQALLCALEMAEGAIAWALDNLTEPNPGMRAIYQHVVEVITKAKECPDE